jgi:RNA polymerase sigma factor (sigma-70 family)
MNTNAEKEAFLKLIRDNQRIIFKICNGYCKNKAEREDLSQEIIYHLWKSAKNYKPEFKFSTWMYRVALNVAISFYRRKLTRPEIIFPEAYPEVVDHAYIPDASDDKMHELQIFIHGLKELDRAILLLYLEEKSYKEIAEIAGITETNAATKISRIKNQLKIYFIQKK